MCFCLGGVVFSPRVNLESFVYCVTSSLTLLSVACFANISWLFYYTVFFLPSGYNNKSIFSKGSCMNTMDFSRWCNIIL